MAKQFKLSFGDPPGYASPETAQPDAMLTIAIEQSTPTCSVALLDDNRLLQEEHWTEAKSRNQQLFPRLRTWVTLQGLSLPDVERFAVGLGPGSFAGIRISLSAARAMALPGARQVTGISSGEVIAQQAFDELDVERVSVVGDARRKRLWLATFDQGAPPHAPEKRYRLIEATELSSALPDRTTVVTPDWPRLAETLPMLVGNHPRVDGTAVPRAATLGRLAQQRIRDGNDGDPLAPVYLHPAVFVSPNPI